MGQPGSVEPHAKLLHAWHLAILRFAVTLENSDRLNVFSIANEIDRLGRPHESKPDFVFFRKTSAELCAAILQPSEASATILGQYLERIDDARLKRALAAALEIDRREWAPARGRSKSDRALWKGLPSRRNIRA